jgi:sec-independent protein translocase protein TatB
MFDIGFSELFLIAVVALIVIGPERLPKVARTMGHLFGRMQRYVSTVKADIKREMDLEELNKLKNEFQESAKSAELVINEEVSQAGQLLKAVPDAVQEAAQTLEQSQAIEPPVGEPSAVPEQPSSPQLQLDLEAERDTRHDDKHA